MSSERTEAQTRWVVTRVTPAWIRVVNRTDFDLTTGCHEYRGAPDRKGYMAVKVDGCQVKVHVLMYERKHGPLPPGLFVLHRCDNPPCWNLDHLFAGTLQDNADDRGSKGRTARGEHHGRAVLSEAQVREIRSNGGKQRGDRARLAEQYSVNHRVISDVLNGKTWNHVTRPSNGGQPLEDRNGWALDDLKHESSR